MIKAKKSLGQNFLIDQNIIDKIINTVEIDNLPQFFVLNLAIIRSATSF